MIYLKESKHLFILLILLHILPSCQSEYDKYAKRELAKGIVYDSLILDMYMGQTQKEFFEHCWSLNKQQLISQGTGNRTAKYIDPEKENADNSRRKEMLFYGIFDQDNIMRGMEMTFHYLAWSPWNPEMHADQLVEELKLQYVREYGPNPFVEIDLKNQQKAFVKIDGNRQIVIFAKNKKDVMVKIEDLRYKIKEI